MNKSTHQVNTGQTVFAGNLLCPQVFLHGNRIVGTALHGGVVGHDHALHSLDTANASDDSTAIHNLTTVQLVPGQGTQLQEG